MNPIIEKFENKLLEDPDNEFLLKVIEKSQIKNISKMKAPTMYMLGMLNDLSRNEFYRKLIEEHAPGKDVLEIGSGLGLLCKYLVDAKCASVTSCEINPHNFSIAKKFLADNSILDKVVLKNKSSFGLRLKKDLEKVDLIVQELWPNNGFSENILSTIKNAKRLLRPGGKILPGNFEIKVVPANFNMNKQFRLANPGVDISSWDNFFTNKLLKFKDSELQDYSKDSYTAFSIDLNSNFPMRDSCEIAAKSFEGYNAAVIYLRIFHDDLSISTWNKSGDQFIASLWQPLIYRIDKGCSLKLSYDRDYFSVTSAE
ncbi:MAG: class I SAM-dependent methyltransferase [Bacteriovoracaceae bacterium]|nr:class I SAM-dependent methyltransferase [Bacteriovoracaceae bacterium]